MNEIAGISFRRAVPDDVPFLLKLREDTMSAYLSGVGIELSPEQSLARVMHRFECAEIVLEREQPVGLRKLHRDKGGWEIIQLQICPLAQGRGLGTQLMLDVIREARLAKVSISLYVLRGNPAKKLYESLGFMVTGSDDHEYAMKLIP